jgi:hypothetical protein
LLHALVGHTTTFGRTRGRRTLIVIVGVSLLVVLLFFFVLVIIALVLVFLLVGITTSFVTTTAATQRARGIKPATVDSERLGQCGGRVSRLRGERAPQLMAPGIVR